MIEINGLKMYDTTELCEMLGVGNQTITRYRREGRLAWTLVARKKYTSEEALRDFLNGKTQPKKKSQAPE